MPRNTSRGSEMMQIGQHRTSFDDDDDDDDDAEDELPPLLLPAPSPSTSS